MSDVLLDDLAPSGPASLKRQLRDEDIACPAGRVVGDAGCFCSLEQGVVDGRTQTASIGAYCMSEYVECPTWQAEKRRLEDSKDQRKSLLQRPDVNKLPANLRRDRLREAQERLVANTPEGRRFRKRLGLRETL